MEEERPLIYLACPYRHRFFWVVNYRVRIAGKFVASVLRDGEIIFSPINYLHEIAKKNKLPTTWEYWETFLTSYLKCSREMYVLMMDGWEDSTGVKAEMKIATEMKIPITYVSIDDFLEYTKDFF